MCHYLITIFSIKSKKLFDHIVIFFATQPISLQFSPLIFRIPLSNYQTIKAQAIRLAFYCLMRTIWVRY